MRTGHDTRSSRSSGSRGLARLALAILLATLAVNLLSAFIRHAEAGLGCADRVACYALLGEASEARDAGAVARGALAPASPAKRAHRTLAGALVLMVLALIVKTRTRLDLHGFEANAPFAIAGLLLLLAVIGPASYLKANPAIATSNLLGGMALAALSFRLWLGLRGDARIAGSAGLRGIVRAALALLLLQLALGAWTSAGYAGLSCDTLLRCSPPAGSIEAREATGAFWFFRTLVLDATGRVVQDGAAAAIHLAHRALALPSALLLALAVLRALREDVPRSIALPVMLLPVAQLLLGVLQVATALPLVVVLAHGCVATLTLLATIRLERTLRPAAPAGRAA